MGEIAINPIHNVHKKYRTMNLVNPYIFAPPVDLTTNTEIGGVASTISTSALLATRLGIDVSRITNFTIVGSDIKCKITGSYAIPNGCWKLDTNITYYRDTDNLVTSLKENSFSSTTKIKRLEFNGVTSVEPSISYLSNIEIIILPALTNAPQYSFHYSYYLEVLYIPNATLGATSGNNNVFDFSIIKKLYASPAMATNNAGAPDGDISFMTSRGMSVSYVANFTVPSAVSDLSLSIAYNNAAEFSFTAPSSTNTIDYYEGYLDGAYIGNITERALAGLTQNTSYTNISVKAVDIYYNKSALSNAINFTTANVTDSYYTTTDVAALAYLAASGFTGTDAVSSTHYLIYQLKNKGLWWRIKAAYLFKGTSAAQQKYNARNPVDTNAAFRLNILGSGTYSDSGWQLNGTNAYADTFIVPLSDIYSTKHGITIAVGTNVAKDNGIEIGSYPSLYMYARRYNSNYERNFYSSGANIVQTGVNDAKGIWSGVRQGASVTKFFRNNTQISSTSSTAASILGTGKIFIGALQLSGSPYAYSGQRIQMVFIHDGFSDAEIATTYNIIDASETIAGRKTW